MENFNIIEYRGFKNIFIGLAKYDNERYCIIYGKTGSVKMNYSEEKAEIYGDYNAILATICKNKEFDIEIPFIPNENRTLSQIQLISNKNEYYTILSILETLL